MVRGNEWSNRTYWVPTPSPCSSLSLSRTTYQTTTRGDRYPGILQENDPGWLMSKIGKADSSDMIKVLHGDSPQWKIYWVQLSGWCSMCRTSVYGHRTVNLVSSEVDCRRTLITVSQPPDPHRPTISHLDRLQNDHSTTAPKPPPSPTFTPGTGESRTLSERERTRTRNDNQRVKRERRESGTEEETSVS